MQKNCLCPHCGKQFSRFCNPFPTADVIIYEPSRGIVIIQRVNAPLGYALPGGFIDEGEMAEEAACREVMEETGLEVTLLGLLGVYSEPHRDPRSHTLTMVYVGRPADCSALQAGDDAAHAAFYPLSALPSPLVFDHARVLRDFCSYVEGARHLAGLDGAFHAGGTR
ncbi:MAG: NUDIX hydrolase [Desulfovibrio sp.]|nr:NUDIX hydrolase [Desulfovibrio sp.]